jgi:drug/metabolite transporter (DMT)-like permease
VIFNISSVFTYFLSLFLLKEPFSFVKLFGVIATFGGAAMIAFSDKFPGLSKVHLEEWVGDIIMAGGAIFWGLYLVIE